MQWKRGGNIKGGLRLLDKNTSWSSQYCAKTIKVLALDVIVRPNHVLINASII